jgi:hypothetical protein
MPEPRLYAFSTHIGTACPKQMRTYADLAEKLSLTGPIKGLARELDITESFLDKLVEEVRRDLAPKRPFPRHKTKRGKVAFP